MMTAAKNQGHLLIQGDRSSVSIHLNDGFITVSGNHNVLLVWKNSGVIDIKGNNNKLQIVDVNFVGGIYSSGTGNKVSSIQGEHLEYCEVPNSPEQELNDGENTTFFIQRRAAIEELQHDSPRGITGPRISNTGKLLLLNSCES